VSPKRASSPARQRLLETADRLFYKEGVRAVGIDRIIAEAGVAKMTLYTNFPSKDALIVAVLQHREEKVLAFFRGAVERHGKRTKNKLRAFFASLKEWFESPDFRGCAFQNAAVELADPGHAGTQFVRQQKRRFADLLKGLLEEDVGPRATKIAPTIALLVEGAIMTAAIQGTAAAADVAREAALQFVEDARRG
jgi:AcrR family transcriptional regulator